MPFENVAAEITEFVDRYIDTFASWDLLSYFHENPGVERKLSGIALEIGRKASSLEQNLESLVEIGLLEKEEDDSEDEPAYRYSAPADFRVRMDRFMEASRDRTNRLAIVSLVLRKEARRL